MFVTLLMTLMGGAVIAFYVQFLVALCKESKPKTHVEGSWLRLRLESDAGRISEGRSRQSGRLVPRKTGQELCNPSQNAPKVIDIFYAYSFPMQGDDMVGVRVITCSALAGAARRHKQDTTL
jgi:hypothetical protein